MDYDVAIASQARYMRVTVSGRPTFEELVSLIHLIGLDSEGWTLRTALVDLRRVETRFSEAEQFRIGIEAAASLSHMEKIASLVPAERVTRLSERAARRNGTNVRVFAAEEGAVDWLQEGQAPLPRPPALVRALSRLRPGPGSRG
jgi:hypothetical protein